MFLDISLNKDPFLAQGLHEGVHIWVWPHDDGLDSLDIWENVKNMWRWKFLQSFSAHIGIQRRYVIVAHCPKGNFGGTHYKGTCTIVE